MARRQLLGTFKLSEHPSIPFPSFPSAFHPVKCRESCTCRSPDEGKNVGSMPWALVWMCEFKWVVVVTFAVSFVLSVILQMCWRCSLSIAQHLIYYCSLWWHYLPKSELNCSRAASTYVNIVIACEKCNLISVWFRLYRWETFIKT